MSKFKPVTLTWQGKAYTIAPDRMMGAIGRIEDFITLVEIERYTQRQKTLPMAKLASAFAAVLTFAGAGDVAAEDVYAAMFENNAADAQESAMKSVIVLMSMMVPPSSVAGAGDGKPGKPQAAARRSKSRTKSRL